MLGLWQDDVIPLSKPITQKNGKVVDHVTMKKGATIFIPIQAVNRVRYYLPRRHSNPDVLNFRLEEQGNLWRRC